MGEFLKIFESVKSKAEENDMELIPGKKRKLYVELGNVYSEGVPENSVSPAGSTTSGCLSKYDDESSGVLAEKSLKSLDLQFETEISTSDNGFFSRETTPTSEICGDSEQGLMYSSSTPKKKSRPVQARPPREIPAEKMPPAGEIEEFFAAAEKCEQKRFAEKYNYDIVKDVPLEGKYQWVCLHP